MLVIWEKESGVADKMIAVLMMMRLVKEGVWRLVVLLTHEALLRIG